jgi:hypothetical protein
VSAENVSWRTFCKTIDRPNVRSSGDSVPRPTMRLSRRLWPLYLRRTRAPNRNASGFPSQAAPGARQLWPVYRRRARALCLDVNRSRAEDGSSGCCARYDPDDCRGLAMEGMGCFPLQLADRRAGHAQGLRLKFIRLSRGKPGGERHLQRSDGRHSRLGWSRLA